MTQNYINIDTPTLKNLVGKKVVFYFKFSGIEVLDTINEIYKKQINFELNGWYQFKDVHRMKLYDN